MRSPLFFSPAMRGFTLVELLICIAIFGILSTIVIADYPAAQMRLKLMEINQNITLAVREAQLRGSAIDSRNSAVGGYGVYISSADPSRIIMFNDFVSPAIPQPNGIPIGDGIYQSSPVGEDETNTVHLIPFRFSLAKRCVLENSVYSCDDSHTPPITSLTISFIRPNPMPYIYINNSRATSYSAACLELQSPNAPNQGHVRNIQIFNSGLIKHSIGPC